MPSLLNDLAHPKPGEIEAFIRLACQVRGIDADRIMPGIRHEGGVDEPAVLGDFSGSPWFSGKSWWPLQLHYGGPEYAAFGGSAGMGNTFTKLTGWQPGDPRAWRDSTRYGLNRGRVSGWGAWYGFAAEGITGFDGIDRSFPWNANAERWDYEDGIPSQFGIPVSEIMTYDPNTPPERQIQDYACSIRTATWMLKSLGVDIGAGAMQEIMVPKYVTPDLGLLDGRGYGLADVLRSRLPSGADIQVHEAATWNQVTEWAGHGPIGIGSHSLYHWLAVRSFPDADGALSGMNPAPNWKAVGDQITQDEFDAWSPWNVVRVVI